MVLRIPLPSSHFTVNPQSPFLPILIGRRQFHGTSFGHGRLEVRHDRTERDQQDFLAVTLRHASVRRVIGDSHGLPTPRAFGEEYAVAVVRDQGRLHHGVRTRHVPIVRFRDEDVVVGSQLRIPEKDVVRIGSHGKVQGRHVTLHETFPHGVFATGFGGDGQHSNARVLQRRYLIVQSRQLRPTDGSPRTSKEVMHGGLGILDLRHGNGGSGVAVVSETEYKYRWIKDEGRSDRFIMRESLFG